MPSRYTSESKQRFSTPFPQSMISWLILLVFTVQIGFFFGERYGLQGYLNMVARIIDSGALSRQNMVEIEFIDEDELLIANFVEHPMTV